MVVFLPVYIIGRIIIVKTGKKPRNFVREVFLAVFFLYSFALAVLLFKPAYGIDLVDLMKGNHSGANPPNFIPGQTIKMYLDSTNLIGLGARAENLFGNLFCFTPIGFGLPLLWKRWQRFWAVFLFGLIAPLFVETIQYFTARYADIDDLMLNCIGVTIGYIIYKLIFWLSRVLPRLSA